MFRSSTLLALFASHLAAAAPTWNADGCKVLGAVYFITNSPNGNQVAANEIKEDGKIYFASVTSTNGTGNFGAEAAPVGHTPHVDALFSQHPVVTYGSILLAVNPGSNTVSLFDIDSEDPTKLWLKSVESSGGEFPVSAAISHDGKLACVLNSGGSGAISCFSLDGGLKAISMDHLTAPGINQTDPPLGPGATVSDGIFDNQGNFVVAVKGTGATDPGFLAFYPVTDSGLGKVTKVPVATGGALPFGMSAALDGSPTLFVTDPAIGVEVYTNGVKGSSTSTKIPTNNATCWSAQSKATGSYFSIDAGANIVNEFQVQDGKAEAVKAYNVGSGAGPTDSYVASTPAGDFLYVLLPGTRSIAVFSVGTEPGEAKLVETLALANKIDGLTVSMAGLAVRVS